MARVPLVRDALFVGAAGRTISTFDDFVEAAAGVSPYDFQRELAEHGLPEVLEVPTGSGKTLAAVLPWLWRRRFAEASVRTTTPHWLVFVLPMRVLVEQSCDSIARWLDNLRLNDSVGLHRVMGGESRQDHWRRAPERDAIFVGTLDLLISKVLNRGYGTSRFVWPIDFGLFNSDAQWVFDEVQLMGPALPTSRQLQSFRERLGTAAPCHSMWMSATIDPHTIATVDRPDVASVRKLSEADRRGALSVRLDAPKTVNEIDASSVVGTVVDRHRPGSLSLVVVNTVERARDLAVRIAKADTSAEVVLLHSRFRPDDRRRQIDLALAPVDETGPGRIVVATQVVEAGVDISAAVMVTEAAPWSSVVQRAGRCNRDGLTVGAEFWWYEPANARPYETGDVAASAVALRGLMNAKVTPGSLSTMAVPSTPVIHSVIRLKDLLDLFDTTPDVSGNDIDISRFIRDSDDSDVQIAWRVFESAPTDEPMPAARELCSVPVGEARKFAKSKVLLVHDHLQGIWRPARVEDVRPGRVLLARSALGGYESGIGWSPTSNLPVPVIGDLAPSGSEIGVDEDLAADPLTYLGRWVGLREHLEDVERDVRSMVGGLRCDDLSRQVLESAAIAGRLHDIGKAHPAFQAMLASTARDAERQTVDAGAPWAKSANRGGQSTRRWFRHELASALMLFDRAGERLLSEFGVDADLVRYLVASHHGRVRMSIRSMPGELAGGSPPARAALGIWDGDTVPSVEIPGGTLAPTTLDLGVSEMGESECGSSWSARAFALRDRSDLGPFRLAFCEALVRLSDWRSSSRYEVRDA